MRRIIFSADDFGMSSAVNAGVLEAHRSGVLSDTSLMVGGVAAQEAIEIARRTPSLSVGLHLVLVQGRPILPPGEIPGLVGRDGLFHSDPIASGVRFFFRPSLREQLRAEIVAQLEVFQRSGLPLSHVDGHLNIHMHPAVLPILLELSERHGIRAMRITSETLGPALAYDRSHALRKGFERIAFAALGWHARRSTGRSGIRCPQHVFGLHQTGRVDERYLLHVLASLPQGLSEIYCHAGYDDEEAQRWRPSDYDSRAELRALTSGAVARSLEENGIERTSYAELAAAAGQV